MPPYKKRDSNPVPPTHPSSSHFAVGTEEDGRLLHECDTICLFLSELYNFEQNITDTAYFIAKTIHSGSKNTELE